MPLLMLVLIPLSSLALAVAAPVGATARAAEAAAARWAGPVHPVSVVRPFAVGPYPWSPGHRGVDLAASPGASVRSPADGVVTFAGSVAGRGVVVISHRGAGPELVRSSFEPVRALVAVGATTVVGQIVAEVAPAPGTPGSGVPGSGTPDSETPDSETPDSETPDSETPGSETPDSETPGSETPDAHCRVPVCLHWGVRVGASYVDPMGLIGIRPVVLLPLVAVR